LDELLRHAAITGITPRDHDIGAAVVGGTAVERLRARRALHAAVYEVRCRQLDGDPAGCDEEVASEIETTATALSGLARPAGRPS
jgi:hypothetical protein